MPKRKKDWAEQQTDKQIEELEEEIYKEYKEAYENVKKKYDEYSKKFLEDDAKKKKQLADGEITEDDYKKWKTQKLMVGSRWKALETNLAQDLTMVDQKAMSIVNGYLPEAYALNFNYSTYELEEGINIDTSFTLYSRETVEKLFREGEIELPKGKVDIPEDMKWNKKHITSAIMQGILSGDDIPTIGERLQQVTDMDRRGAIRNARTLMTGAQNSGRIDAYGRISDMGVEVKKQWLATLDHRTRDSHQELDGQIVDLDKKFSNGLMYPGDPNGEGSEVYNCRCTLVPFFPKYDADDWDFERHDQLHKKDIKYTTYKEWEKAKKTPVSNVVNGKDISATWQRRPELFDFEIEDVINAQGFDGLPRVVSEDEFNKAVENSSFIAQRSYSAPDQETLDTYRDMLYNGKWDVDCSTGGAQYGQGMYCAADYTGNLSDGIKAEMQHYVDLNVQRNYMNARLNKIKNIDFDTLTNNRYANYITKKIEYSKEEFDVFIKLKSNDKLTGNKLPANEKAIWESMLSNNKWSKLNEALHDIMDDFRKEYKGFSYIETFTLDPSAKIIKYNDLQQKAFMKIGWEKFTDEATEYIEKNRGFMDDDAYDFITDTWFDNTAISLVNAYNNGDTILNKFNLSNKEFKKLSDMEDYLSSMLHKYNVEFYGDWDKGPTFDYGSYAALLGYDAINAEGHGQSGSYTVILNRTKLIIKENK